MSKLDYKARGYIKKRLWKKIYRLKIV
jgi:hypothetical protein